MTCLLGLTCDLLPAIRQMRANGHGAGDLDAVAYARLDQTVARGIGDDVEVPTTDELMVLIAWMSGTPPLPDGVDLQTYAASRNLALFQARAYQSGEGTTVSTPEDLVVHTTRSVPAGVDVTVPPGCNVAFTFGTPWWFKDKNTWDWDINFHYGQHLDSVVITDDRRGGPYAPCPPTRATIDMWVKDGHRHWPFDWKGMNDQRWIQEVTTRSDAPYVNCYDSRLCKVVQVYANDQRSVLDPQLWGTGEYRVELDHSWELSHGYDAHLNPYYDGYGPVDDGYFGSSYNQECRWFAASEALVPESCRGRG